MTTVPTDKANLAPVPQDAAPLDQTDDLKGAPTPPGNQPGGTQPGTADADQGSDDEPRDQDQPDPEKFIQRFSGNDPESPDAKSSSVKRKRVVVLGCATAALVGAWAVSRRVRGRNR